MDSQALRGIDVARECVEPVSYGQSVERLELVRQVCVVQATASCMERGVRTLQRRGQRS